MHLAITESETEQLNLCGESETEQLCLCGESVHLCDYSFMDFRDQKAPFSLTKPRVDVFKSLNLSLNLSGTNRCIWQSQRAKLSS